MYHKTSCAAQESEREREREREEVRTDTGRRRMMQWGGEIGDNQGKSKRGGQDKQSTKKKEKRANQAQRDGQG
jgi:hypothetical protein